VAEGGDGTLVLPPDVAPPSQRAWRLSDDPAPVVEGKLNEFPQSYIDVVGHTDAQFDPIRESARGEPGSVPGVVAVVVVPDQPAEPCVSGPGSPATADITYDDGRGRVEVLTVAARIACRFQSGGSAPELWIWSADFAIKGTARA
jgi:hypothetical protein